MENKDPTFSWRDSASAALDFEIFATANKPRNYATETVGFSRKFMARRLPTNSDLHLNSVPDWQVTAVWH